MLSQNAFVSFWKGTVFSWDSITIEPWYWKEATIYLSKWTFVWNFSQVIIQHMFGCIHCQKLSSDNTFHLCCAPLEIYSLHSLVPLMMQQDKSELIPLCSTRQPITYLKAAFTLALSFFFIKNFPSFLFPTYHPLHFSPVMLFDPHFLSRKTPRNE